ncbi:ATP-binding protein [Archaeoglobus neptunius]|uniref:ATP-binding protein n=1 Tax=Archaeoglobus neptunius TaxID=2798580 RepID=UPI0019284715|nr:P-loop NTPase [Archaeoglobus neptunius]
MKILVCGKGGCGKSVVSALLAKELASRGGKVLVIDADESNFGIHRNLGVKQPRDFMDWLGGKEKVRETLFKSIQSGDWDYRILGEVSLDNLPEEFVEKRNGIAVMAIGKIHDFGEGCACPMGAVAREFLESLKLGENEFVVVDTDAGIEHFGRSVEAGCDTIVVVIEPSYEAVKLAEKIAEMGNRLGKRVIKVANKVDDNTCGLIEADVYIRQSDEIYRACLFGEEIPLVGDAKGLVDMILGVRE